MPSRMPTLGVRRKTATLVRIAAEFLAEHVWESRPANACVRSSSRPRKRRPGFQERPRRATLARRKPRQFAARASTTAGYVNRQTELHRCSIDWLRLTWSLGWASANRPMTSFRVHVGRGAAADLKHVNLGLFVMRAVRGIHPGSPLYSRCHLRQQQAQIGIYASRTGFHQA